MKTEPKRKRGRPAGRAYRKWQGYRARPNETPKAISRNGSTDAGTVGKEVPPIFVDVLVVERRRVEVIDFGDVA